MLIRLVPQTEDKGFYEEEYSSGQRARRSNTHSLTGAADVGIWCTA